MVNFRVVKVRIRRGGPGENMMVYPERYDAQEVDRRGIGPLNVMGAMAYSGHIGMGGEEEWCLITLPEGLAQEYAKDPNMTLITPDVADELMENWRKMQGRPLEIVSDPNRLLAVRTKLAAGLALSEEDRQALDPNDPMPGITKCLQPIRQVIEQFGNRLK